MWRCRALPVALATVLVIAGCSTDFRRTNESSPLQPQVSPPATDVTVVTDGGATARAISVSRALYDQAAVVVLADADDAAGHAEAAGAAVELGVPMLLTSTADGEPATVRDELVRLGTETVLAIGAATIGWADQLDGAVDVVTSGSTPPPAAAAHL